MALVTGAPGWLGSRLVECLVRGLPDLPELEPLPRAEIRCLVQRDADPSALCALPGVRAVPGDLADGASLRRFVRRAAGATLFHCAGVIHPRWASAFERVNADGTRALLAAAADAGVRRFIHVSSNSPFGSNGSAEQRFTEGSPYHPYMGYGHSKMLAELAVWRMHDQGRLETVIVRAPWFYGPGQSARQTQFFTLIRTGRFPLVGDGTNRRSMAYIDNLCQGLLRAEQCVEARGRAFWMADARPYSMNEILETVEDVMERDFAIPVARRRLRLPTCVSDAARLADRALQAVGLYDQRVHVLSEIPLTIACATEAAERELGYRPTVELAEGMRRSLAWLLARGVAI